MRRPPARSVRRSPAPKPEIPAPHAAAVRPRDLTARFSTNSRSSYDRFHSSLGNVRSRAYLSDCTLLGGRATWRSDAYPVEWAAPSILEFEPPDNSRIIGITGQS